MKADSEEQQRQQEQQQQQQQNENENVEEAVTKERVDKNILALERACLESIPVTVPFYEKEPQQQQHASEVRSASPTLPTSAAAQPPPPPPSSSPPLLDNTTVVAVAPATIKPKPRPVSRGKSNKVMTQLKQRELASGKITKLPVSRGKNISACNPPPHVRKAQLELAARKKERELKKKTDAPSKPRNTVAKSQLLPPSTTTTTVTSKPQLSNKVDDKSKLAKTKSKPIKTQANSVVVTKKTDGKKTAPSVPISTKKPTMVAPRKPMPTLVAPKKATPKKNMVAPRKPMPKVTIVSSFQLFFYV